MHDQDPLDDRSVMEPRGRLPGPRYLGMALLIYALWAAFAGILVFLGILVYAFPIGIAIFIAGVAFAVLSYKLWTSAGVGRFLARHAFFGLRGHTA